ncbi:hypothetical protein B0H13DRAFT_1895495 [Mycena leptocephala]|nr:hypothetical protein B0H13DRAFT_1895495 [Mycena leptocephala]
MYARVYESFIMLIEKSVLFERVDDETLPIVAVVLTPLLRLVLDGSTAAPSATPPTKVSLAATPPPAPARPHNRPKACTPPTQIYRLTTTPPESIPAPTRATIPPPSTPAPTTAAVCAAIRQRWADPPAYGTKPPPFVPARRPHARATPTHERTGRDVPAGEAGAAVEALGIACPTTAFARVAAIGPTCAESGDWRRGGAGAGVIGNGDANGNGIVEAGEEDDEESELPWARCASGYAYPTPTPPSFLCWCAGALVPYLHHHHPYREPRTHAPLPTDGIRHPPRFIHLASPGGNGSEATGASMVEARRGAGGGTSGVWAFPAQCSVLAVSFSRTQDVGVRHLVLPGAARLAMYVLSLVVWGRATRGRHVLGGVQAFPDKDQVGISSRRTCGVQSSRRHRIRIFEDAGCKTCVGRTGASFLCERA